MPIISTNIFHENTTAPSVGQEFEILTGYSEGLIMILDITGTATARTIIFEAMGLNGNYIPIMTTNISDYSKANQTTSIKNELWKVDLTGLNKFRVKVDAITGGNVTIKGKIAD